MRRPRSKRSGAGLSKSKLLSYRQCPRRLWLETHSPELADPEASNEAAFAIGHAVGEIARQIYGTDAGHLVPFEPSLRAALNETQRVLADGGDAPIFEATFESEGVLVRVDVLQRTAGRPKLIEVKASTSVKDVHRIDCAVQAWVLEGQGLALERIAVAHVNRDFVYAGDGNYDGLLVEQDLTDSVRELLPEVEPWVRKARDLLAQPEPEVRVGVHCSTPYACAFYEHCAPQLGDYPVTALRGPAKKLFELMHEGYTDLRDVPSERLSPKQKRIFDVTRSGRAELLPDAAQFAAALEFPHYYLDFETISFAVPIWAGTRPYEALPFQWSCHIEESPRALCHLEFLDASGEPPMRRCAEALIEALGTRGPILVYTSYESRMIAGLAERYPDLRDPLNAIRDRLVDLHPVTRANYYHPDMLGSWSLKAVTPTVAPELRYEDLDEVQDGNAAQAAYLESIDPATSSDRRETLHRSMLAYCQQDTLALVRLVDFFRGAAEPR
jgi:predicted RecB family nuclease